MSLTFTLTAQDKLTLRTAAYGAVSLLAAADAAGSPHKVATRGSLALASATGPVGHALAEKSKVEGLNGKTVAELADQVLPALTETMNLLEDRDPAEADNFRATINVAIEAAARAYKGEPSPVMTEMARKINNALDAA
ncbi:hypothetical protein [Streptomyces formicae]|uniref:D-alanyl-D-alanine carboxypeptidase n=1 Tax=Streptomyces formicae TaxID=1616117 RepID=A0A291QB93_9ACTN|nr:hypothetical protein [Streptomyces formicae]ATL28776.1 D-alanyl-D-alanine carboxypeptidase [Streptomyces formicae]